METAEKLITERSYASLNAEEKASIADLCANEQDFNQMKQFFLGIGAVAETSYYEPSASLKNSLDSVFAAKHGGIGANRTPREPVSVPEAAKIIPMYQQSWFKGAAAVVLLAGVFTIWKAASPDDLKMERQKEQLARAGIPQLSETEAPAPIEMEETISAETTVKRRAVLPVRRQKVASSLSVKTFKTVTAPSFRNDEAADRLESYYADTTSFFGNVDNKPKSAAAQGMDADLYPEGLAKGYVSYIAMPVFSVAESDENILAMIVPAF